MTKEEFAEWKQLSVTQEFFRYIEDMKADLATTPTLRDTADQTVIATARKQGRIDMLTAMGEVDFAE
jgi:hypothetical protein